MYIVHHQLRRRLASKKTVVALGKYVSFNMTKMCELMHEVVLQRKREVLSGMYISQKPHVISFCMQTF